MGVEVDDEDDLSDDMDDNGDDEDADAAGQGGTAKRPKSKNKVRPFYLYFFLPGFK